MPPKKRRAKSKARATQSQRQSQRVTVNIGKTTTTKRKKQSGKGSLPPPSHLHNLAPTFVTAHQVDYVGLIGEISRLTKQVQDPVPIRNPVTPLQSVLQASNAEQMAGEAAIRRAGPTAGNFQPAPSLADERLAQQIQDKDDATSQRELAQKLITRSKSEPPVASSRPLRGRPRLDTQQAVPFGFSEGGGGMVTPSSARPTLEAVEEPPRGRSRKKKLRIVPNPDA